MNLYEYPKSQHPILQGFNNTFITKDTQIFLNDDNIKPKHIKIPAQYSEFYIKNNKDTLLIVVGESWTYGEGFPGIGTGDGRFNFHVQLQDCLGARMAQILGADLYQYSVPGNCNLYIHTELERILKYVSTLGYKQVKVAVLMTENARELGMSHDTLENYPSFWNWFRLPSEKIDLREWLKLYDELFFDYLHNMLSNFNACPIEGMIFRNFTRIATEKRNYNFKIIEETWVEYTSKLINENFEAPILLVPLAFESYKTHQVPNLEIDLDFMEDQIHKVSRLFDIISNKIENKNSYSDNRNTYHNNHPNTYGHLVWAINLIRKAGWKDV